MVRRQRRQDCGQGQIKLSSELTSFLRNNITGGLEDALRLQTAWEQACTPQALKHTDNVLYSKRAQGKVVLVYVDSSHWAAELSMNKELLRHKLCHLIQVPIDDIVFEVSRTAAIKREFKKRTHTLQEREDMVEPVSLTLEEEGYAREMLTKIEDEQLREKLYKAIRADLEWKKGINCAKPPQAASERPESS